MNTNPECFRFWVSSGEFGGGLGGKASTLNPNPEGFTCRELFLRKVMGFLLEVNEGFEALCVTPKLSLLKCVCGFVNIANAL